MNVEIYTDGGSRGNPGPGASAFIARGGDPRKVIAKRSRYIGRCTNNHAEYDALIMALQWAKSRGFDDLSLHSDSELLAKQIEGSYRVRSGNLIPLHGKVMELLEGVKWRITHHKRDHIWIAKCDEMVNRVLDERC
ncbi:MAG: ribonuclease HI family protein [Thermoplasmatota archaeon]